LNSPDINFIMGNPNEKINRPPIMNKLKKYDVNKGKNK